MEVKAPQIKQISIIYTPEPYIPNIYEPYNVIPQNQENTLNIDIVGCTYQHRDIKNTGNRNLLIEDPNGVYIDCGETVFPSFYPIDYTPKNLVISEPPPATNNTPQVPEYKPPEIPKTNNKKEEVFIPPCPSNLDQRVGDFRNEKKIERVTGHKLVDNVCITEYEEVAFVDQYIPSAPQFAGVFSLALVGSSAPLILNAVKPLVKKAISALQKKKKDVK